MNVPLLDLVAQYQTIKDDVLARIDGRYVAEIWHDLRTEASRGIDADESRMLQAATKR